MVTEFTQGTIGVNISFIFQMVIEFTQGAIGVNIPFLVQLVIQFTQGAVGVHTIHISDGHRIYSRSNWGEYTIHSSIGNWINARGIWVYEPFLVQMVIELNQKGNGYTIDSSNGNWIYSRRQWGVYTIHSSKASFSEVNVWQRLYGNRIYASGRLVHCSAAVTRALGRTACSARAAQRARESKIFVVASVRASVEREGSSPLQRSRTKQPA